MCILNFLPWEEPIEFPLPRGRPHIAWVLPVNLSDLGGRLQAFTDTAPQTTMLRLCHRFRDSALSRMPQELLEQIIDNAERAAEAKCQSEWYRDSVCWQGTCLAEDHYHVYGEYVEKLWQKIFVAKHYGKIFKTDILNPSEAEKVELVRDAAMCNPNIHADEEGYALHHDARFRWLERVCLCPGTATTGTQNGGNFVAMNHVSTSYTVIRFPNLPGPQITIRARSNYTTRSTFQADVRVLAQRQRSRRSQFLYCVLPHPRPGLRHFCSGQWCRCYFTSSNIR
jgi:hypothetical protein